MTTSVESLRRRAKKLGYRISKSNWHRDTNDNLGGYQITEMSRNLVIDGVRWDLDLSYVEAFIEELEAA